MSKYTFRTWYNRTNWVTSFNLHPYDSEHVDTCMFFLTVSKPTAKQLREFRKSTKGYKRVGSKKYLHKTLRKEILK